MRLDYEFFDRGKLAFAHVVHKVLLVASRHVRPVLYGVSFVLG